MQVRHITLAAQPGPRTEVSASSKKVGTWWNRVLGCWHKEMSRPFSDEGDTYRTCLNCGARREFDLGRWKMAGGFYYDLPTSRHFRALSGLPVGLAKQQHALRQV